MPRLTSVAFALSLISSLSAPVLADNVVQIYFPGADKLNYVASLIGESDDTKTLAITCGPGIDDDTCGFPSSITVTAGPSTAYVSVSNQEATFIYDCKITESATAVCAETFNGNIAYIASQTQAGAAAGTTSSVITETLGSSDIYWMPITITAAKDWTQSGSAGTTATATPTATTSTKSVVSWSNSTSTATGSNNTTAKSTKTGLWPMTYTGAAVKLSAVGNYAAGVLALANLVL